MSHYETLGVERGASADEIKQAYRKRSSAAHPDKEGGSKEEMQRINEAYDVLRDPERRARYDATGDGSAAPDPRAEAKGLLMRMFGESLNLDIPVLTFVSNAITNLTAEASMAIDEYRMRQRKLERRRKSVRHRGESNLFDQLAAAQINDATQRIEAAQQLIATAKQALEILNEYEAVPDEPVPAPQVSPWQDMTATRLMWFGGRP